MFPLNKTNDKLIYDFWFTRYQLPAIAYAVKINLFQYISLSQTTTITSLASAYMCQFKAMDALCTLLSALGFFKKTNDFISLTDESIKYLIPNSDFFWGPALSRVEETTYYQELLGAFKNTYSLSEISKKTTFSQGWEEGHITRIDAEKFTSVMQSTIFNSAVEAVDSGVFSEINTLLDIGGGSGCFSDLFIRKYPEKKAIIFELSIVNEIINDIYKKKFLDPKKIEFISGNFFKDTFPETDGILFSNILHDWSPEKVKYLLKKAHESLMPKGKIIIHEMLLNQQKNGPVSAAAFNLLMYINHRSQQFTYNELDSLLTSIGFKSIMLKNLENSYYSMIIAQK